MAWSAALQRLFAGEVAAESVEGPSAWPSAPRPSAGTAEREGETAGPGEWAWPLDFLATAVGIVTGTERISSRKLREALKRHGYMLSSAQGAEVMDLLRQAGVVGGAEGEREGAPVLLRDPAAAGVLVQELVAKQKQR